MPELPEVEVAARSLAHWAHGRRVRAVTVTDVRTLDGDKPRVLGALVGKRLTAVERIGKNLLLTFGRGGRANPAGTSGDKAANVGVWSHLGMTGKWLRRPAADPPPRFARLRIDLVGAPTLYFVDMRLFGFFRVVPGADFTRFPLLAALGPDPLRRGIDPKWLAERLGRSRLPIKVAIMDQRLIPGVGNIQASEGLHRAGIDPRRAARSLDTAELSRLARGILASFRYTLRTFERAGALPPADGGKAAAPAADVEYVEEPGTHNPFRVYDRAGERCRRCRRGTITRIVQAGRSTSFCDSCQR
jgi:formamidopyrimidine-DNA glycosylase